MNFFLEYKNDIAALLARGVLGILFLFQGYDKIFGIGLKRTEAGMEAAMEQTRLPHPLVKAMTAISSVMEFAGGILLIAGLWIYPSLTVLAADLLIVTFGMSLRESLWDMRFVWPRLALVLFLLVIPQSWDRISTDHFLHTYGNIQPIAGHE